MFLILFVLNWILKFFVAWLMFMLANWMGLPEWGVIAMTAIGACETKISVQFKNGWSIG